MEQWCLGAGVAAGEYEATEALAAACAARRCVSAASSQTKPGKPSLSWLDLRGSICHARFQRTIEGPLQ